MQSPEGNWTLAFVLYNGVFPRVEKYVVGWKSFLSCLHTSGHGQMWEDGKHIYLFWKIRAGFLKPPCRAGDPDQIQLGNRHFGKCCPLILTSKVFKSPHSWAAGGSQLPHGQESCPRHQHPLHYFMEWLFWVVIKPLAVEMQVLSRSLSIRDFGSCSRGCLTSQFLKSPSGRQGHEFP